MNKLKAEQVNLLKLILRSKDIGDGWRNVSKTLWPAVNQWSTDDLVELREIDSEEHAGQIRLTARGEAVADYA